MPFTKPFPSNFADLRVVSLLQVEYYTETSPPQTLLASRRVGEEARNTFLTGVEREGVSAEDLILYFLSLLIDE